MWTRGVVAAPGRTLLSRPNPASSLPPGYWKPLAFRADDTFGHLGRGCCERTGLPPLTSRIASMSAHIDDLLDAHPSCNHLTSLWSSSLAPRRFASGAGMASVAKSARPVQRLPPPPT